MLKPWEEHLWLFANWNLRNQLHHGLFQMFFPENYGAELSWASARNEPLPAANGMVGPMDRWWYSKFATLLSVIKATWNFSIQISTKAQGVLISRMHTACFGATRATIAVSSWHRQHVSGDLYSWKADSEQWNGRSLYPRAVQDCISYDQVSHGCDTKFVIRKFQLMKCSIVSRSQPPELNLCASSSGLPSPNNGNSFSYLQRGNQNTSNRSNSSNLDQIRYIGKYKMNI